MRHVHGGSFVRFNGTASAAAAVASTRKTQAASDIFTSGELGIFSFVLLRIHPNRSPKNNEWSGHEHRRRKRLKSARDKNAVSESDTC